MVHTLTLLIDHCNQCTRDNSNSPMIITWLKQNLLYSLFNTSVFHSQICCKWMFKTSANLNQYVKHFVEVFCYPDDLFYFLCGERPSHYMYRYVQICNHSIFRVHLSVMQTGIHTDGSRVVPSASGANHPPEDLHSIGGNVPCSIDGFLPNHRAI